MRYLDSKDGTALQVGVVDDVFKSETGTAYVFIRGYVIGSFQHEGNMNPIDELVKFYKIPVECKIGEWLIKNRTDLKI
jgi:hypothetical protein